MDTSKKLYGNGLKKPRQKKVPTASRHFERKIIHTFQTIHLEKKASVDNKKNTISSALKPPLKKDMGEMTYQSHSFLSKKAFLQKTILSLKSSSANLREQNKRLSRLDKQAKIANKKGVFSAKKRSQDQICLASDLAAPLSSPSLTGTPNSMPNDPALHFFVAGADEVGRGAFAGPVVASIVIFGQDLLMKKTLPSWAKGINDSKRLSASKREKFSQSIKQHALAYSFGLSSPLEIDQINVLQATKLALSRALQSLYGHGFLPDAILLDGLPLGLALPNNEDLLQYSLIKGDMRSISVSAASILAKVFRDKLMVAYANEKRLFFLKPYAFSQNKGYGVKSHREALLKQNHSFLHRKSFLNKLFATKSFF